MANSDTFGFMVRCPRCNEAILKIEDGWICSDGECGYFVKNETLDQVEIKKHSERPSWTPPTRRKERV
jgi:hypothetical protein